MAEVTHRSFDLKSWQGLTDVLKIARENSVDPAEYAEFRNIVLQYAQQKGTDPELKKNIEMLIQRFTETKGAHTQAEMETKAASARVDEEHVTVPPSHGTPRNGGRRTVPVFTSPDDRYSTIETERASQSPAPAESISEKSVEPESVSPKGAASEEPVSVKETASVPVTKPAVPVQETLKSIEEHRMRIMEIKRRVNSLVGNPVTLMDHGNHLGREYMAALLSALKATSPGSTLNVEKSMSDLEGAFAKILELGRTPSPEERSRADVTTAEVSPAPERVSHASVHMPEPKDSAGTVMTEQVSSPSTEGPDLVLPTEGHGDVPTVSDVRRGDVLHEPAAGTETETGADRWSEAGGDADVRSQVKALRETLKEREGAPEPRTETPRTRRPLIASLVDMEEEPLPSIPSAEGVGGYADASSDGERTQTDADDELSQRSLTNRPLSSLTGITLGTPQAELATQEVTGVLSELLHDWSIFASSGIFGMGPSGMDHPLYERLSRLPMGEVLAGRFENADMKLVRNIKEYVNAWRHEQGIAYNPSETFEHYLRRVAQRILKRQNCVKAV